VIPRAVNKSTQPDALPLMNIQRENGPCCIAEPLGCTVLKNQQQAQENRKGCQN